MFNGYVKKFVDEARQYARDTYRDEPSPLLADAYDNITKAHKKEDFGKRMQCKGIVCSNLARQMNFMRTLYALYVLEGDEEYKQLIWDNMNYYFDHYQYPAGLIEWGGHQLIDLQTLKSVGEETVHELKNDYPSYKIMHKVNSGKTYKYMEAFWNAHVYSWETLEISRHGDFNKPIGKLWEHEFNDPEPFEEVLGLSFINAGNDLIYSAFELFKLSNNKKALEWGKNLVHMYVKARNADTGLGVYQFNQPKLRDVSENYSITTSNFGDRAKRQMGPELGEYALEGNVLIDKKTPLVYGYNILLLLHEAQTSGGMADEFITYCRDGLEAFAQYAYIPERNMFRPVLADGQDLTGFELKRDGYYGKKGSVFNEYKAEGLFFLSFVKTALLSGSKLLWKTASDIAQGLGFGYIGDEPAARVRLDMKATSVCPFCLFAFLNLYKLTGYEGYLQMSEVIASNISQNKVMGMVYINKLEPLAVICCEALIKGQIDKIDGSIFI